MEGTGEEVAAWLSSPAFEQRLFTSFPCTNVIPSRANQVTAVATGHSGFQAAVLMGCATVLCYMQKLLQVLLDCLVTTKGCG